MSNRNLIVILALIAVIPVMASAADPSTYWSSGTIGNWADAHWNNGVPTSAVRAYLINGGTATINSPGQACLRFYVGSAGAGTNIDMETGGALYVSGPACYIGYDAATAGSVGSFTLNGGTLTTWGTNNPDVQGGQLEVGVWGGCTGTFYQNGGAVTYEGGAGGTVFGNAAYYVGGYGTGYYYMTAGTLNAPWLAVGYGGNSGWTGTTAPGLGYFTQTGGTVTTPELTVGGGWDNGGTGTYTISGSTAVLTTPWITLGTTDYLVPGDNNPSLTHSPTGHDLNQNGGTVTVTNNITVGCDIVSYQGYGGVTGVGTYNFYGGTLTDGGGAANLVVRAGAAPTGTFQGKGVVDFHGTLTNNGRVIADGGTLDLTHFTAVANTVPNNTTNGWFAKNAGKLMLPSIAVSANGAYNWGENLVTPIPTLVNSAKVTVHGLVGGGALNISLLDPANAEAPGTSTLLSVVGVWDVVPTFTYTNLDLSFRYDDALAGASESSLRLFTYTGGNWLLVGGLPETTSHIISATGRQAGFYAVSTWVPGNVNSDGVVNTLDIDAIYAHLGGAPQYDVNGDTLVNQDDVTYEVRNILHTGYGDTNLDRKVNFGDFQVLLDHWQGTPLGWANGDFTGDRLVNFADFQKLLDYWNPIGYEGSQVPEPASLILLGLGGLALLRKRSKA